MRKLVTLSAVLAVSCVGLGQVRGADLLRSYASALSKADSISASYTVSAIGGETVPYKVELRRPNRLLLESPTKITVATGTEVITYKKAANGFYKRPQTDKDIQTLLSPVPYRLFTPFYNADVFSRVVDPRSVGSVDRKGTQLQGVRFTLGALPKKELWTMYFDPAGLIRQAQYVLTDDRGAKTWVMDTSSLTAGSGEDSKLEWKAPEGAKEIDSDKLNKGEWFDDIAEAKQAAAISDRLVLLVFSADFSHVSKQYEREVLDQPSLKRLSDQYVFCKVDAGEDDTFREFGVTAVPTLIVIRPDGSVVRKQVGGLPLDRLISFLRTIRASVTLGGD